MKGFVITEDMVMMAKAHRSSFGTLGTKGRRILAISVWTKTYFLNHNEDTTAICENSKFVPLSREETAVDYYMGAQNTTGRRTAASS